MKKLIIILVMLLSVKVTFAQLGFSDAPYGIYTIAGGMHQLFINNPGFDKWTQANYNRKISNQPTGELNVTYFLKKYDFGGHVSFGNPYGYGGFFFGRRLTSLYSPIGSWLNVEFGGTYGFYDSTPPLNYIPTADQQGQDLRFQFNASYIGLSSWNYINALHFRVGRSRGVSFNPGFFFSVNYDLFRNSAWKYGYYTSDDNGDYDTPPTSTFNHVLIKNVPKLNPFFMDAGIFIGFGN